MLETVGQVQLRVQFGGYSYLGRFHVLRGDVPLILGMEFLASAHPYIDFKNKKVVCYVGNKRFDLPTCEIGNVDEHVQCADSNQFAGLDVENLDAELASNADVDRADDVDSSSKDTMAPTMAKHCRENTGRTGRKCQRRCNQCGKIFVGSEQYCTACEDDIINLFQ